MTAAPFIRPKLLPVTPANIPQSMLDTPRWAPWRGPWDEKKKKYGKIPHRADRPKAGLSNQSTKGWSSFHAALRAYQQNPDMFAGVGYLMTGAVDLVAVDLDHCVKDGEVDPRAAEIVAKLDSYTELSPSGTGLRIMFEGAIERDWVNHEIGVGPLGRQMGIEVYGGTEGRFVTITGARLAGSSPRVRKPRPGAMDSITSRYRKVKTVAEVEDLHLPPLLGEDELPELDEIDLPPYAKNFLLEGAAPTEDRSRMMFATAIALRQSGLTHQQILSIMEANEHFMEAAMDHRKQDYDKTLRYLWDHHVKAGAARAEELRQLDLAQFDMMDEPEQAATAETEAGTTEGIADDFDVLEDDFADLLDAAPAAEAKPAKRELFTPVRAGAFAMRSQPAWIIKGFLPQAGLAVIYGASGSGKTFFTLDFAGAVARGGEWRGLPVKQGRVVYVVAEGASGFQRRLAAYCQFHGIDIDTLDVWVIADVPNLLDKSHIKALHKQLAKIGPVSLIVIDTYARVMAGGNENDAKDTGQAVAHCDQLHRALGAMVVLVHHSGKDAAKGARGSGALRAAADLEVEVIQTREYRAATVTKMKDGEDNAEYAFKLAEVVLGQDDEGDNITSCVAEARGTQPKHERKLEPKGDIEKLVFQQLGVMADLGDPRVSKDALVEVAYPMLDFDPATDKKDRRKEAIKRAIGTLVSKNLLVDCGLSVELAQ